MSKIPIDLPPDAYPELDRKGKNRGSSMLTFVAVFGMCFLLIWIAMEII